jgi:Polysaccharide pyruvyl transferase
VLALESVGAALAAAGLGYDIAWSPAFRPGGLALEAARPGRYSHLIFICGPAHGEQVTALHRRFAGCRRIAVGVSVIDPTDPAVTGFDIVLARDGGRSRPVRDLAAAAAAGATARAIPVVGLVLATGQGEYGQRRRHAPVADALTRWLGTKGCAPVPLDTRLDTRDWSLCSTAEAFMSLLARLDLVVTTRLHGLTLALAAGVPALAVDPVAGGGKVTAQAAAWDWPCLLPAEQSARAGPLDAHWDWCLSAAGRDAARAAAGQADRDTRSLLGPLIEEVRGLLPPP